MNRLLISLLSGVGLLALASSAMAADLIIDEPMAGVVDVSGAWDGPFVGVFGGYGWGDYSDSGDFEFPVDGWMVGVAAGANFMVTDGIVAGIVGDVAWSNMSGTIFDGGESYTVDIDWTGSLRGKLGFDGGAFMPYLTAGLAVAGVSIEDTGFGTDSGTHVGWTAGAGIEFAATDNVSIDLLYRYSDYGAQTYNVNGVDDYDATLTAHQLTVGLNWSF